MSGPASALLTSPADPSSSVPAVFSAPAVRFRVSAAAPRAEIMFCMEDVPTRPEAADTFAYPGSVSLLVVGAYDVRFE